jgi:tRNA threonylcarbamoyladenosine biosynthesis protein TsaB
LDTFMLAVDSSTESGSVALADRRGKVEEIVFRSSRGHSVGLMPALDRLLRRLGVVEPCARVEGGGIADFPAEGAFHKERPGFTPGGRLAAIAVTLGPGSFTGVRVGLATVKGLALGWDVPVVPFNTLEVMAHGLAPVEGTLVPLLDARKGEVYGAIYRRRGEELEEVEPPFLRTPEQLARDLASRGETLHLFGGGALLYPDILTAAGPRVRVFQGLPPVQGPRAQTMARLAWSRNPVPRDRIASLDPIYIRPTDVEFQRGGAR